MKNLLIICFLITGSMSCFSQYNKEKLTAILTSGNEKSWIVAGINSDRPEKKMTFTKNNSVKTEAGNETKTENWSLKSTDDIRWFIQIGEENYELIVSYDKKGNEYLKLTHQSAKKSENYQMKLNPVK